MRRVRHAAAVRAIGCVAVLGALVVAGCSSGAAPGHSGAPAAPISTIPASSAAPGSTPASSAVARPSRHASSRVRPHPSPTTHPSTVHPPSHSAPPQVSSSAPAPTVPAVSYPPGNGPLVVLDPGHDGGNASHVAEIDRLVPAGFGKTKACNTTGTETNAGYPEHAFTWDVAQRVRRILTAHGVRVIETRHNDTGVGPCVNVRAAIESTPGVVAAVAIHADGAPSSGHGFHVCYASRQPVGASDATMADSRALSVAVHNALERESGLVPSTYIGTDGYYPRSDEAGINLSTVPTTFLELGNMRNSGDAALQSSAAGRQQIATAVAAGILAYLGER